MGKKAVFFDIDGTLFDTKNGVPQSTKDAIKQLRENGSYAFVSTGRSRAFISDKTVLSIGFDGISAACGAYINLNNNVVMEKTLKRNEILSALEVFSRYDIKPVLEGSEYLYMDIDIYEDRTELNGFFGEQMKEGKVLSITGNENTCTINKMTIHFPNVRDVDNVIKELENTYDYVYHKPAFMELLPKGYNKGTGVKYICDYLGIDIKDTYAFGDSSNDLDMFNAVNTAVCMGNGTTAAKEASDYVTDTLGNDGIYKGLKHFGLV